MMKDEKMVSDPGTEITIRQIEVPVSVVQAFDKLEEIDLAIKRLTSYKDKYRKYLASSIAVESVDEKHDVGEIDGIRRTRFISIRTSYQKVLEKVVDTLVSRTKLGEVASITEGFTKASTSERYTRVKEEDDSEW